MATVFGNLVGSTLATVGATSGSITVGANQFAVVFDSISGGGVTNIYGLNPGTHSLGPNVCFFFLFQTVPNVNLL